MISSFQFCTGSFIPIFLHCVKPCLFSLFSSTIACVHFWTVAICAVFDGFYSCSFVMFLFSNFAFALSLNYHLFLLYNFSQLFPLNQVFYDCTFSHQSDRPLYFLPPSHSCWCQKTTECLEPKWQRNAVGVQNKSWTCFQTDNKPTRRRRRYM